MTVISEKSYDVDELAKVIWDYHKMGHSLRKADCIVVLGSHDTRVAERGAELFLEGWAPLIIFSGGLGNFTKYMWTESEAEKFARIAENMGVPRGRMLLESKSTNTGENIIFTKELMIKENIKSDLLILIHKPYMERRSYATFKKIWPEKEAIVTSPQISYEDYANADITMDDIINIMVGDFQRVMVYPKMGFQIHQDVPEDAQKAFEELVKLGYTKHLIK